MSTFALICAAVLLASLLVLFYPCWRPQASQRDELRRARFRLHDSVLAELRADLAAGRLDETAYTESVAEAESRLLTEVGREAVVDAAPVTSRLWLVAIGVLLPLLAGLLYLQLGKPAALDAANLAPPPQAEKDAGQIEGMVKSLEAKMALNPDDAKGWLMLARSYRTLARYDEAVAAYEKAWPVIKDDAGEIARFAGSLAVRDKSFTGRPTQLLARALELKADEPDALMLAGSAAVERGDRAAALEWWGKLHAMLEPGSEDEKWLSGEMAALASERKAASAAN